jgi:hypothetical protein
MLSALDAMEQRALSFRSWGLKNGEHRLSLCASVSFAARSPFSRYAARSPDSRSAVLFRSLVSQLGLQPLNGEHRLSCFAIRSPVACFAARSPSSRLYRASVSVLSLVLGSWKLGREDCSMYAGTCFEARSPVSRFVAARSVHDGVYFSNVRFLLMPNVDSMGSSGIGHVL